MLNSCIYNNDGIDEKKRNFESCTLSKAERLLDVCMCIALIAILFDILRCNI